MKRQRQQDAEELTLLHVKRRKMQESSNSSVGGVQQQRPPPAASARDTSLDDAVAAYIAAHGVGDILERAARQQEHRSVAIGRLIRDGSFSAAVKLLAESSKGSSEGAAAAAAAAELVSQDEAPLLIYAVLLQDYIERLAEGDMQGAAVLLRDAVSPLLQGLGSLQRTQGERRDACWHTSNVRQSLQSDTAAVHCTPLAHLHSNSGAAGGEGQSTTAGSRKAAQPVTIRLKLDGEQEVAVTVRPSIRLQPLRLPAPWGGSSCQPGGLLPLTAAETQLLGAAHTRQGPGEPLSQQQQYSATHALLAEGTLLEEGPLLERLACLLPHSGSPQALCAALGMQVQQAASTEEHLCLLHQRRRAVAAMFERRLTPEARGSMQLERLVAAGQQLQTEPLLSGPLAPADRRAGDRPRLPGLLQVTVQSSQLARGTPGPQQGQGQAASAPAGVREQVLCTAMSPDAQFVAAATSTGAIRVWKVQGLLKQQQQQGEGEGEEGGSPVCMHMEQAFSQCQSGLSLAEANLIDWPITVQQQVSAEPINALAFTADGSYLITTGSSTPCAWVWCTRTASCVAVLYLGKQPSDVGGGEQRPCDCSQLLPGTRHLHFPQRHGHAPGTGAADSSGDASGSSAASSGDASGSSAAPGGSEAAQGQGRYCTPAEGGTCGVVVLPSALPDPWGVVVGGVDGSFYRFQVPQTLLHRHAAAGTAAVLLPVTTWACPPVLALSSACASTATAGGSDSPQVVVALCQGLILAVIDARVGPATGTEEHQLQLEPTNATVILQDVGSAGYTLGGLQSSPCGRYLLLTAQPPPLQPLWRQWKKNPRSVRRRYTAGAAPAAATGTASSDEARVREELPGPQAAAQLYNTDLFRRLTSERRGSTGAGGASGPAAGLAYARGSTLFLQSRPVLPEEAQGGRSNSSNPDRQASEEEGEDDDDDDDEEEAEAERKEEEGEAPPPATLVLWDLLQAHPVRRYRGHVNHRFALQPLFLRLPYLFLPQALQAQVMSYLGCADPAAMCVPCVACGSEAGSLHVWNLDTEQHLAELPLHSGCLSAVSSSAIAEGGVVTGGDDGALCMTSLWAAVTET